MDCHWLPLAAFGQGICAALVLPLECPDCNWNVYCWLSWLLQLECLPLGTGCNWNAVIGDEGNIASGMEVLVPKNGICPLL